MLFFKNVAISGAGMVKFSELITQVADNQPAAAALNHLNLILGNASDIADALLVLLKHDGASDFKDNLFSMKKSLSVTNEVLRTRSEAQASSITEPILTLTEKFSQILSEFTSHGTLTQELDLKLVQVELKRANGKIMKLEREYTELLSQNIRLLQEASIIDESGKPRIHSSTLEEIDALKAKVDQLSSLNASLTVDKVIFEEGYNSILSTKAVSGTLHDVIYLAESVEAAHSKVEKLEGSVRNLRDQLKESQAESEVNYVAALYYKEKMEESDREHNLRCDEIDALTARLAHYESLGSPVKSPKKEPLVDTVHTPLKPKGNASL